MVQEEPVVPLNVFDESEYGSDHDKETGQIKYIQVSAPGNIWRARAWHGVFLDFPVKMRRGNEEKGKEENLNHEPNHDKVLAVLHTFQVSAALNAAA